MGQAWRAPFSLGFFLPARDLVPKTSLILIPVHCPLLLPPGRPPRCSSPTHSSLTSTEDLLRLSPHQPPPPHTHTPLGPASMSLPPFLSACPHEPHHLQASTPSTFCVTGTGALDHTLTHALPPSLAVALGSLGRPHIHSTDGET